MPARLEIIMGNMFSGKTSELIRRLKRHSAIGDTVLVINSKKDVRNEGDFLQTHDRSTFDCLKTNVLADVFGTQKYFDAVVVAVDEAQFFEGLRPFVEQALKDCKHVILTGLDGDFKQQVFGELLYLVPLADDVTKLKALCMECMNGTLGPFSKRTSSSTEQELVGDVDVYRAVCRMHL
jgi:thymidine kinase